MMTNPLREGYISRKRWCERGLEKNLGRERESDTREKRREKQLKRRKLGT